MAKHLAAAGVDVKPYDQMLADVAKLSSQGVKASAFACHEILISSIY